MFDWSKLGDVSVGRQNLGEEMPVLVYRLLQYTVKDELVARYGSEVADDIIRAAGHRAGTSFSQNVLKERESFDAFIADLQKTMKEMKIGVLRIEKADVENMRLVLTVSEDLDCSGLPVTDETVCVYDEGFIAGILEEFTGNVFEVQEIDCWATGDRTCRFTANKK